MYSYLRLGMLEEINVFANEKYVNVYKRLDISEGVRG